MNDTQKLEAIRALLNGDWDNEQLMKIGPLFVETEKNICTILDFKSNVKYKEEKESQERQHWAYTNKRD